MAKDAVGLGTKKYAQHLAKRRQAYKQAKKSQEAFKKYQESKNKS